MIEIRHAKIFCGTKKKADYRIELQYRGNIDEPWRAIYTEWATEEDKRKYEQAKQYELLNDPRP